MTRRGTHSTDPALTGRGRRLLEFEDSNSSYIPTAPHDDLDDDPAPSR